MIAANSLKPEVVAWSMFGARLCVPRHWSDGEILAFAKSRPEVVGGWGADIVERFYVAKAGDVVLAGDEPRIVCEERPEFVHVVVSL